MQTTSGIDIGHRLIIGRLCHAPMLRMHPGCLLAVSVRCASGLVLAVALVGSDVPVTCWGVEVGDSCHAGCLLGELIGQAGGR